MQQQQQQQKILSGVLFLMCSVDWRTSIDSYGFNGGIFHCCLPCNFFCRIILYIGSHVCVQFESCLNHVEVLLYDSIRISILIISLNTVLKTKKTRLISLLMSSARDRLSSLQPRVVPASLFK